MVCQKLQCTRMALMQFELVSGVAKVKVRLNHGGLHLEVGQTRLAGDKIPLLFRSLAKINL